MYVRALDCTFITNEAKLCQKGNKVGRGGGWGLRKVGIAIAEPSLRPLSQETRNEEHKSATKP